MGYIDPRHPFFDRVLLADGPGVHTDEASSALPDLVGRLPAADIVALGRVSGELPAVRRNPAGSVDDAAAEDDSDVTVAMAELMPLAYLVTGQWGPEAAANDRVVSVGQLARKNPRDGSGFWSRMDRLSTALSDLRARALQRYAASTAKRAVASQVRAAKQAAQAAAEGRVYKASGTKGRTPWVDEINKMIVAVEHVRAQRGLSQPSILRAGPAKGRGKVKSQTFEMLGLPKKGWGVLAEQGNQKLPFVAYSELPMATCPGAGACGVTLNYFDTVARWESRKEERRAVRKRVGSTAKLSERPRRGWCYSFRAFRYPSGFSRQFLNTLANYADREFAIMAGGGGSLPESDYAGRVNAALRGAEARVWPQMVKAMVVKATKKDRAGGKPVFFRLFVDGDINTEDCIVEWMQACREMDRGGRDVAPNESGVSVYGYSKCWNQFLNVDQSIRGKWPTNYALNLSSGSVYFSEKYEKTRRAMEKLPITRGYFEAIPLSGYIDALKDQTEMLRKHPNAVIPMPAAENQHFAFDPERVRAFLRINGVQSYAEAVSLVGDLGLAKSRKPEKLTLDEVRHLAYQAYVRHLVRDPQMGAIVRRELLRDSDAKTEPAYLARYEQEQRVRLQASLGSDDAKAEQFAAKKLEDKALALVLHETLWTYGLGGSCPLVCSACSSHPTDPKLGAHRCADMGLFRDKTIRIGIHRTVQRDDPRAPRSEWSPAARMMGRWL